VATFPIDHVIPGTRGGTAQLDNLALACPHGNAHQWAFTDGHDPESGRAAPLFNPRTDVWSEHFRWSDRNWGMLEGRTAIARATIDRLEMNHLDVVAIRRLLAALGVAPDAEG